MLTQVLSPFLKMGITRAILRESGKVPREREWLIRFEITVFLVSSNKN